MNFVLEVGYNKRNPSFLIRIFIMKDCKMNDTHKKNNSYVEKNLIRVTFNLNFFLLTICFYCIENLFSDLKYFEKLVMKS